MWIVDPYFHIIKIYLIFLVKVPDFNEIEEEPKEPGLIHVSKYIVAVQLIKFTFMFLYI